MNKNVIITSTDGKKANFVINHWLRSLKDNVNLKGTDVVVIDYGLSKKQAFKLKNEGVLIYKGSKKSHIVNKRFFDGKKFLLKHKYDQVLFIDGGDVIFQEDISSMFKKDKDLFRVAPIGMEVLFFEWFISLFGSFSDRTKIEIWKKVKNKPVINAGVIFSPSKKFIDMCREMEKMIRNKESFGPDQIILNYYLYKNTDSFKFLDEKYNFMMSTTRDGFSIKKGVFYKKDGSKVAIVHNAGQMDFFRPIENFGYGPKYNQIKHIIYHAKRTQYRILELYKKVFTG
jgi:hypothetical protein